MARFGFALMSAGFGGFSVGYVHIGIEFQGNGILYKLRRQYNIGGSVAVATSSAVEIPDAPILSNLVGYTLHLNVAQPVVGTSPAATTFEIIRVNAPTTDPVYRVNRYLSLFGATPAAIDIAGDYDGFRVDNSHPVLRHVLSGIGVPGHDPGTDFREYFGLIGRWPVRSGLH
jgi:hypothetical protein